jgi:hypothetical protein
MVTRRRFYVGQQTRRSVTAATTLSDVVFLFGTQSGQTLPGVDPPAQVAEPASALVMASGLLSLGLFARRKAAAK